jgi:hypothetical protein
VLSLFFWNNLDVFLWHFDRYDAAFRDRRFRCGTHNCSTFYSTVLADKVWPRILATPFSMPTFQACESGEGNIEELPALGKSQKGQYQLFCP